MLSASLIGSLVFGPVMLSNIVIVVGIDAELIPSLGFAAQIDLSAYGTTYDSSIALFFDSGDPARSLFAGSVSDITLKQVANTIVGAVTGGDVIPGWLGDLLDQVGVSGTSKVTMPSSVATALDTRDFGGITAAFNAAYKSTGYSFTAQNTLLAALGFTNPMDDSRFCTRATGQLSFHTTVSVAADFASTVSRVSVTVRYNNATVGSPCIFTGLAGHTWTAAWAASAGNNFQVRYTVTWLNPSLQPVTSPWLDQKGTSAVLPIAAPQQALPEPV
jgi:hypothetical protein